MARFIAAFILLALLASFSGRVNAGDMNNVVVGVNSGGTCAYLASSPGGCPDGTACLISCRTCYRGRGHIRAECVAPGGDIHVWECRCYFEDGAPCPPPPPACPVPPVLFRQGLPSH